MKMMQKLETGSALAAVGIMWLVALLAVAWCGKKAYDMTYHSQVMNMMTESTPPRVTSSMVDASKDDYNKIVEDLKVLHTSLSVQATDKSISISANGTEKFAEWLNAVYAVAARQGFRWQIVKMCAGVECGAQTYSVEVKASKLKIDKVAAPQIEE